MIARRTLLGVGLGAGLSTGGLLHAHARARDQDAALRDALDALSGDGGPREKLARLAGFAARDVSPAAAIDLDTVRGGLAVDAALENAGNDARFALLLERRIGARLAPAAVHRRLLAEGEALHARADRLLRQLGQARGSVGARIVDFYRRPEALYPDTSTGRDRAVADMNAWLDAARGRVAAQVGPVPAACRDVRVRRMSPAEEAAGKAGYRVLPAPGIEGGAAGAYFVDLREIARRPRWSLASVVAHELLPGHMVQLPIEGAARPHPLRLAYLPAFSEGWAIYAEVLADRSGAFAGDPAAELGHIHWLLFRIARGVVDTGIHHARWSDAEAHKMLRELQGEPAYFASFADDLERVRREPATRAGEALVWLELAERARAHRSPASLRQYHVERLQYGRQRLDRLTK